MFNEHQLSEKLNNAVDQMAPDILDRINNAPVPVVKDEYELFSRSNPKNKFKILMSSAAMLAVIFIAVFTFVFMNTEYQTIYIDVNPSIKIILNKDHTIKSYEAVNNDAVPILKQIKDDIKDLPNFINSYLAVLKKSGYLKKNHTMLLSIQNNLSDNYAETSIKKTIENSNSKLEIVTQSFKKNKESEKLTEKYNLSPGKAELCAKIIQKQSSANEAEICKKDLDEVCDVALSDDRIKNSLYDDDSLNTVSAVSKTVSEALDTSKPTSPQSASSESKSEASSENIISSSQTQPDDEDTSAEKSSVKLINLYANNILKIRFYKKIDSSSASVTIIDSEGLPVTTLKKPTVKSYILKFKLEGIKPLQQYSVSISNLKHINGKSLSDEVFEITSPAKKYKLTLQNYIFKNQNSLHVQFKQQIAAENPTAEFIDASGNIIKAKITLIKNKALVISSADTDPDTEYTLKLTGIKNAKASIYTEMSVQIKTPKNKKAVSSAAVNIYSSAQQKASDGNLNDLNDDLPTEENNMINSSTAFD